MAMMTQVIDAGETDARKLPNGWGQWHLFCLCTALKAEGSELKAAFSPGYIFQESHTFTDPEDGEVFTVNAGDTFLWWWDR